MANEADNNNVEVIDLRTIIKKIRIRKKLFYKTLPIAFVLSCAHILCVPRYYTSETKLAPEVDNSMAGGTLSSIASSFGFDLGNMQTSDAITPLLYPDLMEDNKFVTDLFNIKVVNEDGDIKATYYDYLTKYQKKAWWIYPIEWVKKLFPIKDKKAGNKGKFDPYYMSKKQNDIAEKIRDNISLDVDKKTGVITISTKAHDALICKTLADSVRTKLQAFITEYRTNKARVDLNYYKDLLAEAKQEYEKARRLYGSFSDSNTDIILESVRSKQNDLENDMQLKYNTYSTLMAQYQAAKAKVQERTPAFTIIKGADVPVKPAGPKRMIFVFGILFMTFIGTCFYIMKDDLGNAMKASK